MGYEESEEVELLTIVGIIFKVNHNCYFVVFYETSVALSSLR